MTDTRLRRHPAKLHRALIAFDQARLGHQPPAASPIPLLVLMAVGVWAAFAAEFTTEAWPLGVVAVVPVIGCVVSWFMNRKPVQTRHPRRPARPMIDRRPLLLRRVIVLPPARRGRRITGAHSYRLRLDATAGKPSRGCSDRAARLKARVHKA